MRQAPGDAYIEDEEMVAALAAVRAYFGLRERPEIPRNGTSRWALAGHLESQRILVTDRAMRRSWSA